MRSRCQYAKPETFKSWSGARFRQKRPDPCHSFSAPAFQPGSAIMQVCHYASRLLHSRALEKLSVRVSKMDSVQASEDWGKDTQT